MDIYRDKKTLVAGGTGLIGRPLVERLVESGAKVRIASLDDSSRAHPEAEFIQTDLTDISNCMRVCKGMDYVFNLLGVKGNPKMCRERPASFFVPTILFNTNMMEAARKCNVERYLYTSTIGVYSPAEIFREDDVWETFPSENDWFAGWAKRMGELQAEAYKTEYGWEKIAVVRPANVYGPYDNFHSENAMVIPSLIARAVSGENPLVVWGDGNPIRDFIHAEDVARGMALVVETGYNHPINLGSGDGCSIKDLVKLVLKYTGNREVVWDNSKPSGDRKRLMDISRARAIGWSPTISLEEGIKETIEWYKENRLKLAKRYEVFDKKGDN